MARGFWRRQMEYLKNWPSLMFEAFGGARHPWLPYLIGCVLVIFGAIVFFRVGQVQYAHEHGVNTPPLATTAASGPASTTGPNSPANTGSGNSFSYGAPATPPKPKGR